MYVLDTDVVTLFFHHQDQQPHLVRRILATKPDAIWISIVTVEEILGGALNQARNPERLDHCILDCRFLRKIMGDLARFQILPFDRAAKQIFEGLTAAQKRVGKNDCKISSIAHSRDFTVVTRNVSDFGNIGVAKFEDWTLELRKK